MLKIFKKIGICCLLAIMFWMVYWLGFYLLKGVIFANISEVQEIQWHKYICICGWLLSLLMGILALLRLKPKPSYAAMAKKLLICCLLVLMIFIIYWESFFLLRNFIFAQVTVREEILSMRYIRALCFVLVMLVLLFSLLLLNNQQQINNLLHKFGIAGLLVLMFSILYVEGIYLVNHFMTTKVAGHVQAGQAGIYVFYGWLLLFNLILFISLFTPSMKQNGSRIGRKILLAFGLVVIVFMLYWAGFYFFSGFMATTVSGYFEASKSIEYIGNNWLILSNIIFFSSLVMLDEQQYHSNIFKKIIISFALVILAGGVYWVGIYFFVYQPTDLETARRWFAHVFNTWLIFSNIILFMSLLLLNNNPHNAQQICNQ